MKAQKSQLGRALFILSAVVAFVVVSPDTLHARHQKPRNHKPKPNPPGQVTPTPTPTPTPRPTPTPTPTPVRLTTSTPTPTPSQAPTSLCDATAAQADQCYSFFQSGCFSGFAAFLPGLDCSGISGAPCDPAFGATAGTDGFKFVFSPAGTFTENANGTATLTGHLESLLQPGFGFDVSVTFTGRVSASDAGFAACAGNPLLELDPCCYVNGPATTGTFEPPLPNPTPACQTPGTIDPSTWHYYTSFSGTLTGTGSYLGLVLTIEDTMHCFEVGTGASGKNVLAGASGWFIWSVTQNTTGRCVNSSASSGRFGDFNLNLSCQSASGCTLTQGFWKNHPEAWPVGSLTIGGVTYTEAQLIAILQTPPKGDATYILIHQLIAAELSVANGADGSSIAATITAADNFLTAHPLGSDPGDPDRTQATSLASTLDNFNSGITGPGHCPEDTGGEGD